MVVLIGKINLGTYYYVYYSFINPTLVLIKSIICFCRVPAARDVPSTFGGAVVSRSVFYRPLFVTTRRFPRTPSAPLPPTAPKPRSADNRKRDLSYAHGREPTHARNHLLTGAHARTAERYVEGKRRVHAAVFFISGARTQPSGFFPGPYLGTGINEL